MAHTSPIQIVPATTPIPLLQVGTTARHRATQAVWAVHVVFAWAVYGARVAAWASHAWLAAPVEVARGRHVAVAAGYSLIAVTAGLLVVAVAR